MIDRRDSANGSSRTLSRVAFFHDGFLVNKTDLQKNLMGAQRRAQAIATAPRRKRYDDDDEEVDEAKKSIQFFFSVKFFFLIIVFIFKLFLVISKLRLYQYRFPMKVNILILYLKLNPVVVFFQPFVLIHLLKMISDN